MRKIIISLVVLLLYPLSGLAQLEADADKDAPVQELFVRHWYATVMGGMAYDVGEAKFSELLSPAAQVTFGYQFSKILGLRLGVSGWKAKNKYAYPEAEYSWNVLQPALDLEINVSNLFFGWDSKRKLECYALVGGGAAYTSGNEEAWEVNNHYGINFQKLWKDSRWNAVGRFGLGGRYKLSDKVALTVEGNANILPDEFNSKAGKDDNLDWRFNGLIGLTFTFGRSHDKAETILDNSLAKSLPTESKYATVPVDQASFNLNIYFSINESVLKTDEISKLKLLKTYLDQHPQSFVRLSGFADKETGTKAINMRLSVERVEAVAHYLQNNGIDRERILRIAKGDIVQPFDVPEENRVCICYVYNPEDVK